jgi:GTPase SAR1 family protein
MDTEQLKTRLEAFGKWRQDLIEQITKYQAWLDDKDQSTPEVDLRLIEILEILRRDHVTIAFIAEVSSGKTELINSIFFADYKRRLLPSEAGRTTMCPTELFFDHNADAPYIRLLPIETRLGSTSIAEYKQNPIDWTNISLDVTSADSMAEAFLEVTRQRSMPVAEVKRLGLFEEWQMAHGMDAEVPDEIKIPMWRHAMISFPHPLLKQGLVVLDTPGLNALGNEPELTINMLPNAQAVLFIIAADKGVTKSELDMWQHHVRTFRTSNRKGLLVVLNKIDTLWDELKADSAIQKTIDEQCAEAANMLNVPEENVFPVSAQKALLAKVKDDQDLLEKSGILELERTLAEDVLPEKHRIIMDNIGVDISKMIENSREVVKAQFDAIEKQRGELANLGGKNADVIEHLLTKTREEQVRYNKDVESLQDSRRALAANAKVLLGLLRVQNLDQLVNKTREAMQNSWTTHGMRAGMKVFFDSVRETMAGATAQSQKSHKLIVSIYDKFHKEHGFAEITPRVFSTKTYEEQFAQLYKEAEAFRESPMTALTEQNSVVKKFFISMVSRARNIFFNAHHDAENWAKTVMAPLISQVREHKKQIEKRLETLRRINDSKETIETKIRELEKNAADLQAQVDMLEQMVATINRPLDLTAAEEAA